MQHRRRHVTIVVLYRRRLETRPFRRLLIRTPVTDVRRLLTCTSITLVRLLFCTAITLLRRLPAFIRTVRRLLVCIGITRLLTCIPVFTVVLLSFKDVTVSVAGVAKM